jgi:hypothetical protein
LPATLAPHATVTNEPDAATDGVESERPGTSNVAAAGPSALTPNHAAADRIAARAETVRVNAIGRSYMSTVYAGVFSVSARHGSDRRWRCHHALGGPVDGWVRCRVSDEP